MKKAVFILLTIVLLCGIVYGETVNVDINPKSCPNPLTVTRPGFLSVAILGTEVLDVYDIDPASVFLNGVSIAGSMYKDVSTPVAEPGDCSCNTDGPDGFIDLILKFKSLDVSATLILGGPVYAGDVFELSLDGLLTDGTLIEGADCVVISVSSSQEEISVPDVVGLIQAIAETALTDADLRVGTITTNYSDTISAGNVISQDPSSGALLPPGGYVDLVISRGTIPDIEWVSIIDPGVSGHEAFNGDMSKYETTNAQYCHFLNVALSFGDITVGGLYDGIVYGVGGDYDGEEYYNLAAWGVPDDGADNGAAPRINWTGSIFTVDSGFENHPVSHVSWYGAMAFVNFYGWRLPSEWEWQAVADYEGEFLYGCGTSIDNSIANYLGSTHPDGTTVVGSFGSFGYEMCDMAGNVWEWTSSYYPPDQNLFLAVCGGSWYTGGIYCNVSHREGFGLMVMLHDVGFRVCR